MTFGSPWFLLGLILPLLALLWRVPRAGAAFAPFPLLTNLRPSRGPLVWRILIAAGLACLVVAAARPQHGRTITERTQAGRDLMLVIDLSGSMRIDDLGDANGRVDRLAAVFRAAERFVTGRPDDRIGLVFFSANALTSCPLTYDHATVRQFLERTERQQRTQWANDQQGLLGDATNIGLGVGTALKYLRSPNQLGKAVILITDGVDTRSLPGWVDPLVAARHAQALGARVHAVGVGNAQGGMTQTYGGRMTVVPLPREALPDPARLRAIATAGGGEYFSAGDEAGLKTVFERIDALEPTPRTVATRLDRSDRFRWPLALGTALLALALALRPRLLGATP
jgi:Ca-activated chloride channel family protein